MQRVLIGGSSHVGKSTLGKMLAARLDWSCLATDSLARHPGRSWSTTSSQVRQEVAEHYKNLSVESLLADLLCHYQTNVIPQIEIVMKSQPDLSPNGIIFEGSALWPKFVTNLMNQNNIKRIWLTASDRCFQTKIFNESNFYGVDEDPQYLIQKFLQRTLLYNRRMAEEVKRLGLIDLDVESAPTIDELAERCLKLLGQLSAG